MRIINTYSIVAYDPTDDAWGVAVASKFLAAGAVVSWARAGAGAVATQSYANVTFGNNGLALMESGKTAQETLDQLIAEDENRNKRQVGMVDKFGNSASYTGSECHAWAGHKLGEGFACQGNILTGANTLDAMADTFIHTKGELADRLTAALLAGDTIGGDSRGKQSAGVLVVKANAGYGGNNDRYLDLRVDDDPEPVRKLAILVNTHHLYFGSPKPEDAMPITEDIARELQWMMVQGGYFGGEINGVWDEMSQLAFSNLVGNENLEERWSKEKSPAMIDKVALGYLRNRLGKK
ncbi:MAG: DUF1028 domain-containing protein [bacterium]|nr:DUF1028 domain-containing protein [bacterium]